MENLCDFCVEDLRTHTSDAVFVCERPRQDHLLLFFFCLFF